MLSDNKNMIPYDLEALQDVLRHTYSMACVSGATWRP